MIIPSGLKPDEFAAYDALLAESVGVPTLPAALFHRLTPKMRIILEAMRRAAPQPLPRQTIELLLNDNWVMAQKVKSHTIESHLYRLRRTLVELGMPLRIVTVGTYVANQRECGGGTAYLLEPAPALAAALQPRAAA